MKQLILFILLLSAFHRSAAQRIPGSYVVGASLGGLNYQRSPVGSGSSKATTKRTALTVSPMIGRFFTSNLLAGVGVNLRFAGFKVEQESANLIDQKTTETEVDVNLFVRNYFQSAKQRLWPYVEARAGVGKSSSELKSGQQVTGATPANSYVATTVQNYEKPLWRLSALAGGTYMFSGFTGIDVNIGYQYSRYKSESSFHTTTVYGDGRETESKTGSTLKTRKGHIVLNVGILIFLSKLGREKQM